MDTNTIELSLSRNYVCSWGLWEAMREIFQNAIDSDNSGHTMSFSLEFDTLTITNSNVELPINSLVLGNSTKGSSDIGKYGEGYKLAILVLLRLGYGVKIKSGSSIWTPFFEYSETLDTEVLKISIDKKLSNESDTSFIISGLSTSDVSMLASKCIPFSRYLNVFIGRTIESEYGTIYLDPNFKGKFFVEGLFIQNDTSFNYGYSFKHEYVSLDRDRRAINYYDLLELTTNSLLNQSEDITIVETSITNKFKDTKNLEEFYQDIPQDFAVGFAKHFMDKHNLTDDTFVGTEKETIVSGSTNTFTTDKIQAKIVNMGLSNMENYKRIQKLASDKSNKDTAYEYYKNSILSSLYTWLVDNCKTLSNKQINRFLKITESFTPSNYHLIKDDVLDSLYIELKIKTNYKFKPLESDKD